MYISDNGDGTFTNPVLLSDYADCDIIRMDEDYYMVGSSMNRMSGIAILHSKDLVNWRIRGYAKYELKRSTAAKIKEGKNIHSGGPWSPSIRYNKHNGKFYICTTTNSPNEGFMVFVSDQLEGPYEVTVLGEWFFDPGLLVDDDGRMYVYYGRNELKMAELDADGKCVLGHSQTIHKNPYGDWLEGTRAYKIRDTYYLTSTLCGTHTKQLLLRSKSPHGPFESKIVLDNGESFHGMRYHKAGMIDTIFEDWWYFLFQERDYIGRCPVIQPLTWVNGWPIPGDPANAFQASPTWTKPVQGYEPSLNDMEHSDDFDGDALGLHWQWRNNPDDGKWSLTERQGWLRMWAETAERPNEARNMLTQKIVGWECSAMVKMDAAMLKDGDAAGLCVTNFDDPHAYVVIEKRKGSLRLRMVRDDHSIAIRRLEDETLVFLRCAIDKHAQACFSYSLNGEDYLPIGDALQMTFTPRTFFGYRFGLFCHAGAPSDGYVDIDYFHMDSALCHANHFSAFDEVDACRYDGFRNVTLEKCAKYHYGDHVCVRKRDSHLRFDHIDFGDGADWFEMNVASGGFGGTVEIYLDRIPGLLLGSLEVPNTGGWHNWARVSGKVQRRVSGIHRVYLRFTNKNHKNEMFHLDWFRFYQEPDDFE